MENYQSESEQMSDVQFNVDKTSQPFIISPQASQNYVIPLRYRKMENLHIVFWLFKDISWCLIWRPLGISMIFPTFIISLVIAWRTRQYVSELCHNIAISVWIANSYWMICEFFGFDEQIVTGDITYKHLALIPFFTGVLVLAYYYLYWKPKHGDEPETM